MRRFPRARTQRPSRRGAVIIIALIALLLVSMIGGSLLRLALLQRRQVEKEAIALQADWLVQSGLERAVARLRTESNYPGERWRITAEELGGRQAAVVEIQVAEVDKASPQRRIIVTAEFPAGNPTPARLSRQLIVSSALGERTEESSKDRGLPL